MSDFILQEKTLGQLLAETTAKYPNKEAIVYFEQDYRQTWQEFSDSVDALAKGLMAVGVKKGEKVALWASNVPHWLTLMFATARIGAILLPINTSYRERELEYLLKQSETENLFIIKNVRDHNFLTVLNDVIPNLKDQDHTNLKIEHLPNLKRIVFMGEEEQAGMYKIQQIFDLAEQTSKRAYQERQDSLSPHEIVNIQYTSGTTGFPKGVMLTHVGILNNGYWIGKNQKFTCEDSLCLPVPLFHCFGCVLGVMACVAHGVKMTIIEIFSPLHVLNAIAQEKPSALYGVPTMYTALVEHRQFKNFDFSSLRTGIMSGAICPEPLMRRVIEEMNMHEITIPYGLTEGSPVMTMTTTNERLDRRCQSVGKMMPGIEVALFDPESGKRMKANEIGEICCRGYNTMKGYYNMPEATKEAIDKDNWLHTGDLGRFDEDGYLYITGRSKDMIIKGGENIYPREIEDFLLQMPQIQDVQIIGIPSRKYGEEIGAMIILKEGASLKTEEIRAFSKGQIAWHKVPRYVHIMERFPLTASGKIQKYKLREIGAEIFKDLA